MTRHSYHERDYAFGQVMFKLRTSLGLTQAGLAVRLGISRRAVGEWEAGSAFPKAERLQHFVALCVRTSAFTTGREEEEIRALWKMAHQRELLDETWLAALLSTQATLVFTSTTEVRSPSDRAPAMPSAAFPRVDWVGALDVSHFMGREGELAELSHWIGQERCRLVAVLGMGGIGKSALVSLLGQHLAPQFEAVLWRSVRDAPSCEELVADCFTFFSQTPPATLPASLEQRINQLVSRLQTSRCLLVLDNLETLLASGDPEGGYLPGYEGYGRLIERLAESAHQSCVLLTSREKPREIEALEGMRSLVRSLRLVGMNQQTARDLLADKGLSGTPGAWQRLVAGYVGNPLALKIVAQTISDLFAGDIDRFLHEGELVFNGVRPVLRQQVRRLSALEHLLLTWLAVLREWTPLDTLAQVLHPQVLRAHLLEALEALRRRSLLERRQQASFSLQSVVMEFLIDTLGERLAEEIVLGNPQQLRQVALEQAQAKDYVRQTQLRLLVHPLLERLRSELGADALIEAHLLRLMEQFRAEDVVTQGYGPANIISLLKEQRGHLRGLDLSQLAIRGAYLQGVEMQDASLAGATLRDSTFTETFDATWSVAISGTYWAVGSERGEVRVWRVEREGGKLLYLAWQAHTNTVKSLAFSPDERTLATSSWDGAIKLWDLERGALLWTGWQTSSIQRLAFAPDGRTLASGGDEAVIRLWNAYSGTLLQTLSGHYGPVHALAWSPNGRLLASAGFDQQIRLWDRPLAMPETSVQVLVGHTNLVLGLAFAPDGRTLASASWDQTVKLWDVESHRLRETLTGHTDKVLAVLWSPDGHLVASCGLDHTIWLWDVARSSYRTALHGHTAGVYSIAFTPDSRSLLSGGEDGTVRVWDVEHGQCVQLMQGYAVSIYDLAWSPDGTYLASAGTDLLVTMWDVTASTPSRVLRGHRWNVYGVTWSPDGRRLASSGWDNAVRVWDASAGESRQTLRDPDYVDTLFYGVAWSPDGKLLATGSYQRGVQVWEMTTSTRLWVGRGQPTKIRRVAWSPDGTWLASCGDDGSICLWKASDGTLLAKLQEHRGIVANVAWSSDGARLASCGGGMGSGELFVWDARSGERLYSLSEPSEIVYALTWSPTGTALVSGSSDGRLRWWDLQSRECVRVRKAHQGAIQSLRSSPDGQRLASCGDDGALNIWELESGEHLRTLRRDRPYERLDISRVQGLTGAQRAALQALGAIEDSRVARL
jgi:WD40 repeat protein/transcriptional regulator with XRE-family HTH domain